MINHHNHQLKNNDSLLEIFLLSNLKKIFTLLVRLSIIKSKTKLFLISKKYSKNYKVLKKIEILLIKGSIKLLKVSLKDKKVPIKLLNIVLNFFVSNFLLNKKL
jgi:hypothetical protein